MRLPSSNACHDLGPLVSVAKMSRKPSFKRPSIDVTKVEDDLVISTPKSDSDTIFFGDEHWRNRFPSLISGSLLPYLSADVVETLSVNNSGSDQAKEDTLSNVDVLKERISIIQGQVRVCCCEFLRLMLRRCATFDTVSEIAKSSRSGSVISLIRSGNVPSSSDGVLVLTNRGLSQVPGTTPAMANKIHLLDLSANKLSELTPSALDQYHSLRSLFLNQNRLKELPNEIGLLVKLEQLSIAYNFIIQLPASVSNLRNLRELKASNNRFEKFPPELLLLPHLEVLDLSMNMIKELPNGLGQTQLVDLNLNENELALLCDDLGQASKLQILRLQNNKLSLNAIPDNLFSDSVMTQVLLDGNLFELEALASFDGFEIYLERNLQSRRNSKLEPIRSTRSRGSFQLHPSDMLTAMP